MPSIFNFPDKTIKVKYIKQLLTNTLRKLSDYNDEDEIETKSNTYYVKAPYLATAGGFISLDTIEDAILADDMDDDDYELDESRRGFVKKYRGCKIHDMGDVYVCTNENGLNIGEEKTIVGCEGTIDQYLDKKAGKKDSKKADESCKKSLKESKDPEREIMEWAEIFIEDQNRSDSIRFSDDVLKRCALGKIQPPYKKIAKGILAYPDLNISGFARELLANYSPSDDEEGSIAVRNAIDNAIEVFVSDFEM